MTWRWPNFRREELQCRCGCGCFVYSDEFMDSLQALRNEFAAPMTISSGTRCPDHNCKVSHTGPEGPHTKGAVDIAVAGHQALKLVVLALKHGFTGIGVNQKGSARFIHLDRLPNAPGQPRPHCWSY
jgi:zinc D-Ala-D-Ala carboxypeptidase